MFPIFWVPDLRPWGLICRNAEHAQLQLKSIRAVLGIYKVCVAFYRLDDFPAPEGTTAKLDAYHNKIIMLSTLKNQAQHLSNWAPKLVDTFSS